MNEVVLYGRRECGLCDEAQSGIEALRAAGRPLRLRVLDVDSSDALRTRYGERVPVVEVDGVQVCELGLDVGAVEARLDTVST